MKFCALFYLSIGIVFYSQAQVLADSVILKRSKENTLAFYNRSLEGNLNIYNGAKYLEYIPIHDEHPYFLTDDWAEGNILYDGEWFMDIPILFDIEKNLIVIFHYLKGAKMQLNSALVQEFYIQGHHFVNLNQVTDSTGIKNGFYDVLYSGNTNLICSHTKKYIEETDGLKLIKKFKETSQYYILSQRKYHKVGSRKSVLKLLSDKKNELKTFIRKNNLFKKNQEASLNQVVVYYDSIKP